MASLRKPKLKKLPKKPKGKKTLQKMKSYADRANAIIKENDKKASEYNAKKKKIESEKKSIDSTLQGVTKKAAKIREKMR
jgi:hypothetical protein